MSKLSHSHLVYPYEPWQLLHWSLHSSLHLHHQLHYHSRERGEGGSTIVLRVNTYRRWLKFIIHGRALNRRSWFLLLLSFGFLSLFVSEIEKIVSQESKRNKLKQLSNLIHQTIKYCNKRDLLFSIGSLISVSSRIFHNKCGQFVTMIN